MLELEQTHLPEVERPKSVITGLEPFAMPSKPPRTPSYRLHKPTGSAVVTLGGRDVYLGPYGSDESRAAYDRVVSEWLANGRRTAARDAITVAEVIARYLDYVDGAYKSAEPANIRLAIRAVREVYGPVPAVEFGPLALKAIRQRMIDADLCRNEVNKRTRRIVRLFKWAVSEELIPSGVLEALRAVDGLRRGRGVRESKPVRPVHDSHVDATLPHLAPQVRAMVELQRLTGARPGESCQTRTIDVNATGRIWEYTPPATRPSTTARRGPSSSGRPRRRSEVDPKYWTARVACICYGPAPFRLPIAPAR
jgi:hypothetical protein